MGAKDLPLDSERRLCRVFEKFGWHRRPAKRGHLVTTKPGVRGHVCLPDHAEVDRILVLAQVRSIAGLTEEQFMQAYKDLYGGKS